MVVSLIGSRSRRSFSFSSFECSSRLLLSSSGAARSILRRTAGLCRNEVGRRYPRFRERREESLFAVMTSFFLSYK